MAVTNHERVGRALALLAQGLAPFVARECKARYGDHWVGRVARNERANPHDAQFLLAVLADEWREVFAKALGRTERNYVSELIEIRNRWAHQGNFSTDDTYRALDTIQRMLASVAAADQAVEADRMRQDLLRVRFTEQARQTQRRAAVAPIEGQPAGGLRPWRELITPQGPGKVARRPFHGISSSGVRARRSREVGGTYVAKRGRVAAAARVG